ncbi:MAG: hypothetical protein ABIF01_01690, partial [Candidatus Micrarchaeota archaeon]
IATNEYGAPLQDVNLTFDERELQTNVSGEALFKGIRVSKGTLVGKYSSMERTAQVEFYEEFATKTLVFPSTPLVIEKIAVKTVDPYEQNCTVIVSCMARDERVALSKISMGLVYSKNGGEWNSVTQKNELGIFEFEIPCSAPLELSYTLTASNEYGSAKTPIYNMSIPAPVECQADDERDCITGEGCQGTQACVSTSWGQCMDIPDDGCPVRIPADNNTKDNNTNGGPWIIHLPEGLDIVLVVFVLLGAVALIGGLGILVITQREKVTGIFENLKSGIGAMRHVDKIIERADKEYARDKLPEKFMKEGKTDEFFGLDREDGPPKQQPPKDDQPKGDEPPPEEKRSKKEKTLWGNEEEKKE